MTMTRRPPKQYQERDSVDTEHAQLTATTTTKLYKAPAGRAFLLDRILYINPTGLAADATNAFRLEVKNGSTLIATVFNTDSDDVPAGAALAANTFVTPTIIAGTAVLAAGDELSLVFTEDGTSTLPAGRIRIEGRLL